MATGRIGVTPTLRTRWSKQPTAGTTSLSGLDDNSVSLVYDVGYEAVYRNGTLLSRGNDYTATTGTTVTLIDATLTGDIIEILANQLVPLTDAISKGQFTAKGALLSATAASTPGVLAVGTNGQYLSADSTASTGLKWATLTAGGMTLLSTTTLSGATTTISSIDQTYKSLVAIIYGVTNATANGFFKLRPNASAVISTWIGVDLSGANTQATQAAQLGEIYLSPPSSQITRTDSGNSFYVRIDNYASTTNFKPLTVLGNCLPQAGGVAANTGAVNFAGGLNTNSAITSLVFLNSAGNLSTGTVLLYGVN